MKRVKIFAFLLCFCLPVAAQFTTVSGTVIDPNGIPYANGTIVPTLVSSSSPTLNGLFYSPPTGPVGLDINGSFLMNLASQASLLPGGTTWNFTVCSAIGTVQPAAGTGPQCFVVTGIVVAGASQSISTQLQAAARPLTLTGSSVGGSGAANNVAIWASASSLTNPIQNAYQQVSPALPPSGFWVGGTSNALRLINTTAASGGPPISHASSQILQFCGNIWDGAASQLDCWLGYVGYRPPTSANPRATLVWNRINGTSSAKNWVISGDNTLNEGTQGIAFVGQGHIVGGTYTNGTGYVAENLSVATGSRVGYEMFSSAVGCANLVLDRNNNLSVDWSLNVGTSCTTGAPFNRAVIYRDSVNSTGNTWIGGTDAATTTGAGGAAIQIDNNNAVPAVKPRSFGTMTACASNGTAANPSVVTCGDAPSGLISCDAAASGATCVVNTTAITATSKIFITPSDDDATLGGTCNLTPTIVPAIRINSKTAATSFTINVETFVGNKMCYEYFIVG